MTSAPMPWPCSRREHGGHRVRLVRREDVGRLARRHRAPRRWHRGDRRARRAAACRARRPARRGRSPSLHTRAVGPDLEAPRRQREVGPRRLAAGDERSDRAPWRRRAAAPAAAARSWRRRRAAGSSSTCGRPSVPCSSLSTRNGRMNARGWRRWSATKRKPGSGSPPVVHRTDGGSDDADPRRGGRCRRGAGRAGSARRSRRRTPMASCHSCGRSPATRWRCAARSPATSLYQSNGRSLPRPMSRLIWPNARGLRSRATYAPVARSTSTSSSKIPVPWHRSDERRRRRRRTAAWPPARTSSPHRAGAATARPCGRSRPRPASPARSR